MMFKKKKKLLLPFKLSLTAQKHFLWVRVTTDHNCTVCNSFMFRNKKKRCKILFFMFLGRKWELFRDYFGFSTPLHGFFLEYLFRKIVFWHFSSAPTGLQISNHCHISCDSNENYNFFLVTK